MKNTKNKNKRKKDLYEMLGKLPDFRRAQGRMHELRTVLIIIIMAIMSGYHGIRAIGDFIKKNRKDLLELFQPKNDKLPSRQTVGRVLQNTDFNELVKIFHDWAIGYIKIENQEWISIDGKAIGGTIDNRQNKLQNFISLVSIFSSKKKQILRVGKIENKKESEIPKVRELIKQLNLENIVFTLDALHPVKKLLKQLLKVKNNYVVGVKINRKKLYNQLKKTRKKAKP
ncbi:ISAs1 family transposase [Candidatus Parcubacteria bacterium]|nr:ISAs1 family transposase [Candidatus Parcubacteria bacterium]